MSQVHQKSIDQKALSVNLDASVYGSFAEIGAGQEVVRHFFIAGGASGTIAKSISAYDMKFSDEIYGRENNGRYVCKSRLIKMLDHEFGQLQERLKDRSDNTRFFAFADTVATSPFNSTNSGHGWMGIRFQQKPLAPFSEIIVHFKMHDNNAKQQAEAIGFVGVNLIYGATHNLSAESLIDQLVDEASRLRVEIDSIYFRGDAYKDTDNRVMSLKLVEDGFTEAVLFTPKGDVLQISDYLYKKPVLVQRGSFNPVTKVHWDLQKSGIAQFNKEYPEQSSDLVVLMEMTVHQLHIDKKIDIKNFLERIEAINQLNQPVLISNFFLFYQLRQFLQRHTSKPIQMVLGASLLEKLFQREHYKDLEGGVLEGFGRLLKGETKLYVYPQKDGDQVRTSKNYLPKDELSLLYKYVEARGKFVDLVGCNIDHTQKSSEDILNWIQQGNSEWESYVPNSVVKVIKEKKLFGYIDK